MITACPRRSKREQARFRRLADAKNWSTATTPDHIHFHEVGGTRTAHLVDIVGAAHRPEPAGHRASGGLADSDRWVQARRTAGCRSAAGPAALLQGVPIAELARRKRAHDAHLRSDLSPHSQFGPQPSMVVDRIGPRARHRDLAHPNVPARDDRSQRGSGAGRSLRHGHGHRDRGQHRRHEPGVPLSRYDAPAAGGRAVDVF